MSNQKLNFITALIIFIFSFILLRELKNIPVQGTVFPSYLIYGLLCCALLMVIQSFLPGYKIKNVYIFKEVPIGLWIIFVGIFIFYIIFVLYLGFFTATFLVCISVTSILSKLNWKKSVFRNIIFAFCVTILFFIVFRYLFYIPFPDGILI